jgi:phosphoesterase RecJ-like protein
VDLCILLDTSEPARAGHLKDGIFAAGQRRICLDHHLVPAPAVFDAHLLVTEAPATGSLVLALIDRLGVPLSRDMAQALWIAIATDTGWFRFANTTPWALADAARLAEHELELEALYDRLYQEFPAPRVRILGQVLAGIHTDAGGKFVWSFLPRPALQAAGVQPADLEGIIDALKSVRGARIMAFIVEKGDQEYKVSLRARGEANVEAIARRFGGGGHAKAAGYRFQGAFEPHLALLSALVETELSGRTGDPTGPTGLTALTGLTN